MRFGNENGKLIYRVKYINITGERSFTYEDLYKIDEERYFLHYVPGAADEYVKKLSRYSHFKDEEAVTAMNDFEVYAYKKNCELRRKGFSDIIKITDYEFEEKGFPYKEFMEEKII